MVLGTQVLSNDNNETT